MYLFKHPQYTRNPRGREWEKEDFCGFFREDRAERTGNVAEKDVLWYSENPDIAVVDKNGNVTGVSEGTAVICAVAKDAPFTETQEGDNIYYTCPDEFTARFTITVAKYSLGDADIDNVVTATDATNVLQKALINTFELPIEKETDNWLQYVDVDGDTKITANDAALIFRKALVSTFELPVKNNI